MLYLLWAWPLFSLRRLSIEAPSLKVSGDFKLESAIEKFYWVLIGLDHQINGGDSKPGMS